MHAVLLDFNGTMFFDTRFHMEAWSKIYHELHPEDKSPLASTKICGPCNDVILKNMAPWLTPAERQQYSEKKEALYREACRNDPASLHLVAGAEELLQGLQKRGIPFALASASIKANVDFYFDSFPIGHWLKQQDVVYDDGSYADKGEMHLEAARRLGVPFSECWSLRTASPPSLWQNETAQAGSWASERRQTGPSCWHWEQTTTSTTLLNLIMVGWTTELTQ